VAPINVTVSGSSSSSILADAGESTTSCTDVFHIAAYSRHVEKILDVTISQPGACCRRLYLYHAVHVMVRHLLSARIAYATAAAAASLPPTATNHVTL